MHNHATPLRLAYDEVNRTEDHYKLCLVAHYGKDQADTMRYQRTHQDPVVAAAQEAFLSASYAWNTLVNEQRQPAKTRDTHSIAVALKQEAMQALTVAKAADEHFHACLVAHYGADNAGDARYLLSHDDATVTAAGQAYRHATQIWHAALDAYSQHTELNIDNLVIENIQVPDTAHSYALAR